MGGYLTTHVLDTARGRPAAGMVVRLERVEAGARAVVAEAVTNADGRTDAPILPREAFAPGVYELTFAVGAWLAAEGMRGTPFLGDVPVRFEMAEAAHYHVPLLVSPYGYSTYRGS